DIDGEGAAFGIRLENHAPRSISHLSNGNGRRPIAWRKPRLLPSTRSFERSLPLVIRDDPCLAAAFCRRRKAQGHACATVIISTFHRDDVTTALNDVLNDIVIGRRTPFAGKS